MLCNEKRPWADWFLLCATACCLQAPAGAAGQLPQLWLLHRFIERSLKALIVLMLLTICCRFPRWTFLKYFLHTQFDSREAWRTSTTFSRRLGPTLARLPQIVGFFFLSSFWGFQVELTIFHKLPILDPPRFCGKSWQFWPQCTFAAKLGWKQLGRRVFSTMLFKVLLYPGTSLHKSSRLIFLWISENEEVDWRCVLSVALKVN